MILYNSENGIRDIRPFCRPLFCHSNVVKYTSCLFGQWTWNETRLPNITETSPLNLLAGSVPECNKHRLPQVSEVQMFNKFLFCRESLVGRKHQWCRRRGGKCTPKVLICRKSGQNPWKSGQKSLKIQAKMVPKCCLEIAPNVCRKTNEDLVLEVTPKKVFVIFLRENL